MPNWGEAKFNCTCGEWKGWVVVDHGGKDTTIAVKPCPRCRPAAYQRWLEGKWRKAA